MGESKYTGKIFGLDPGGDKAFGIAYLDIIENKILESEFYTVSNINEVIEKITFHNSTKSPLKLGIDTYTYWSSEQAGWRNIDKLLRKSYINISHSVFSINSSRGAMSIGGMATLLQLEKLFGIEILNESHPKVLFYEIMQPLVYDEKKFPQLLNEIGVDYLEFNTDHEFDAFLCAYATWQGIQNTQWADLLIDRPESNSIMIPSLPNSVFYWPKNLKK